MTGQFWIALYLRYKYFTINRTPPQTRSQAGAGLETIIEYEIPGDPALNFGSEFLASSIFAPSPLTYPFRPPTSVII